MLFNSRTSALAGLAAAISMTAAPVAAADLPVAPASAQASADIADFDYSRYDSDTDIAENHRHYRYRRYRGYRHRHRADVGDVIAGVLILGGIAAIANAAKKNDRDYDRDYRRDRDYDRDYDRRDRRWRGTGSSGLDSAVEQCVSRIERDVRVESVDGVDRTGDGWNVTGSLYNGEGFTCRIGNDGRIADIDYGSSYRGSSFEAGETVRSRGDDNQWNDASYVAARQSVGAQTPDTAAAESLPAYPGGPLPGEVFDEDTDTNRGG